MNERLKELRIQAGNYGLSVVNSAGWSETHNMYIGDVVSMKFAELIIKECANFLKDTLDDHFAAEQLEEHFGV